LAHLQDAESLAISTAELPTFSRTHAWPFCAPIDRGDRSRPPTFCTLDEKTGPWPSHCCIEVFILARPPRQPTSKSLTGLLAVIKQEPTNDAWFSWTGYAGRRGTAGPAVPELMGNAVGSRNRRTTSRAPGEVSFSLRRSRQVLISTSSQGSQTDPCWTIRSHASNCVLGSYAGQSRCRPGKGHGLIGRDRGGNEPPVTKTASEVSREARPSLAGPFLGARSARTRRWSLQSTAGRPDLQQHNLNSMR
jgi:hypothetical protein